MIVHKLNVLLTIKPEELQKYLNEGYTIVNKLQREDKKQTIKPQNKKKKQQKVQKEVETKVEIKVEPEFE